MIARDKESTREPDVEGVARLLVEQGVLERDSIQAEQESMDDSSAKPSVPPMAPLKRIHGELWHLLRNIPQHGYTFFTLKAMFERVCDDLEKAAK